MVSHGNNGERTFDLPYFAGQQGEKDSKVAEVERHKALRWAFVDDFASYQDGEATNIRNGMEQIINLTCTTLINSPKALDKVLEKDTLFKETWP